MLKLAVLLSGSGRTLDNFYERILTGTMNAEIQVVISNVDDALGLDKAKGYGYPAFHAVGNAATNEILADYEIELIVLAGYLKPSQIRSPCRCHVVLELPPGFFFDEFSAFAIPNVINPFRFPCNNSFPNYEINTRIIGFMSLQFMLAHSALQNECFKVKKLWSPHYSPHIFNISKYY